MSAKNVTQKCQTKLSNKLSDQNVREICQTKMSAKIVSHIVKLHFYAFSRLFHFPFPRKAILGTQRYPNIKEMHENIKEMHVHTAVLVFPGKPSVPGIRAKKTKKA